MYAEGRFLRIASRITRRKRRRKRTKRRSIATAIGRKENKIRKWKLESWRACVTLEVGGEDDAGRDACALRLQRVGESPVAGCGGGIDERSIYQGDGIELWVGAGYAGAYLRRGMGLAGAVSRAVARVVAGCGGVRGCGESSRE